MHLFIKTARILQCLIHETFKRMIIPSVIHWKVIQSNFSLSIKKNQERHRKGTVAQPVKTITQHSVQGSFFNFFF